MREILVVQVRTQQQNIRIINAYGPQEDSTNRDVIFEFWQEIEQEIISGKEKSCLIVIQLDANAKLGNKVIKDDPNDISENGKIMLDIIKRHNLTVTNSMNICDGVITSHFIKLYIHM